MKRKHMRSLFVCILIGLTVVCLDFLLVLTHVYAAPRGATVTTRVQFLPPSEWGFGEMFACGNKGGTHCRQFGIVEHCVTTRFP